MKGKEFFVSIILWTGFAALVASITVFRPLPITEPKLCDVAQEYTYAAKLQEVTESAIEESSDAELAEELETEVHCTDPASAWVERASLDYSASDAYLLAKIAYAEAGGEDLIGQALVIRVVLNRVWSDEFPDSIPEVIFEEGQFAGVRSEAWDVIDLPQGCWNALELVESGWDESQGATYFCANGESEWHREHLTELFSHGGHVFYVYEGGNEE